MRDKVDESVVANIVEWSDCPPLADDFHDAIRQKVCDERAYGYRDVNESERIVLKGTQKFAVFGPYAHELLSMVVHDAHHFAFRPAILDGVTYRSEPYEGHAGTLHWMWGGSHPEWGWTLTWLNAGGWIYTEELELEPSTILKHIVDEIAERTGYER